MASRKNVRSTTRQIEMLVDYMSVHTHFANGEYSGPLGKQAHDEEWVRIQMMLGEFGPSKTVGQWRTTWRDLKKKARADGARANAASGMTGNTATIPTLSATTSKILGIIGTESAYGMAGQVETQLGEFIVENPSTPQHIIPPPATSPQQELSPPSPTSPQPPTSPPDTQRPTARQRQRPNSVHNQFLVSDAQTRNVLVEIGNSLRHRNYLADREQRTHRIERLQKQRMEKHIRMGPNYK